MDEGLILYSETQHSLGLCELLFLMAFCFITFKLKLLNIFDDLN